MNVRDVIPLPLTQQPTATAGVREPGGSPWLGRRRAATETFTRYQGIERAMHALWPGLSALPGLFEELDPECLGVRSTRPVHRIAR